MLEEIVITVYRLDDPARVLWVLLNNNMVTASGVEYASRDLVEAAINAAEANARNAAIEAGMRDDVPITRWLGGAWGD